MYIMITAVPTVKAPSTNYLALVYKKRLSDKVMMNLTPIQDMGHLKKVNNNYINNYNYYSNNS